MKKLVQIICIVLLTLLFSGPVLAETTQGRILEVEPVELQAFQDEAWENQILTIRLLSGPERGDTIQISHTLTGHPYTVVIIGGVQGIKAIFSLVGMGFVIVKMILSLVFKGYNPIIVTVGLSTVLTMLFVLFIAGRSKKAIAAICGTVGGLIALDATLTLASVYLRLWRKSKQLILLPTLKPSLPGGFLSGEI